MIKRSPKKIPAHYGMSDYYKFYLKNYDNNVNKKLYNKVIGEVYQMIIDEMISKSYIYKIPKVGFNVYIGKKKSRSIYINGRVVNTSPVDWHTTKKLWEDDDEAREKKILVRYVNKHTNKYIFKIIIDRRNVSKKIINDRYYYKFKPSRFFQRTLGYKIKNSQIDEINAYIIK